MSNTDQSKNEETPTALHLSKIIGEKASEPPPTTAGTDESATIVIKKAAAQVAQQSSQPVVAPKGAVGTVPPKQMLGAVAYAYSKGVYRSEDIEDKMLKDPAVRETLHGEVPDARTIRRFRYLNREAIQATLEKFYFWKRRKAAAARSGSGQEPAPKAASKPEENSTLVVKKEAADKLNEAASVDNMLRDR